ncbi:MAG: exo-alpha-sialidase [Actinomycetia bacterium]|nr:exo-alpha-sialidase [Actinomycetes bacterium]
MPRRTLTAAVTVTAALLLTACGSQEATGAGAASSSLPATGGAAVVAEPAWGLVHNLTLDGSRLLLGTHDGLWQQNPGEQATLLSDPAFDVMGLTGAPEQLFASGHPGPDQDLPADLGLRQSTDGGRSWQSVSLEGEVDFHRLRAVGSVILGLSAHDGRLMRSPDSGVTWQDLGTPPVYDIAVDPRDPDRVLATTEQGPVVSTDGGTSFTPIDSAPLLALLAWAGRTVYAAAPNRDLYTSGDAGTSWTRTGSTGGPPSAIAANGEHVVVVAGATIVESTDGGATFTPRITGLDEH